MAFPLRFFFAAGTLAVAIAVTLLISSKCLSTTPHKVVDMGTAKNYLRPVSVAL